jgi:LEA14-like dessication related protein
MKRLHVLLACALLAGCATQSPPELMLVGVAPAESTYNEPRIRLDFRVLNPGRKPIVVKGVDLKLEVNDVDLARGVDGHGFELPAFGEARGSVEVTASILKLLRLLLTLPDAEAFTYELSGRLHLDGFPGTVPISRSGSFSREDLQALSRRPEREPAPPPSG